MSQDLLFSFPMIIGLFLSIEENDRLLHLLGTSVAVSIFTLMAGTLKRNKEKKNMFSILFLFV